MRKILPLFSYLFHPIFIPVLGTAAYLYWGNNYFEPFQQFLILLQIVIITILIPIAFFYLLKTLGKIDNVMVSELPQRQIPLVIQIILFYILLRQSITIDRIPELFFFLLGGMASAFLTLLLSFVKIKASIHMVGISSLTVFVVGLSLYHQLYLLPMIALLIFLNGLIAASRLQLNAHNGSELTIGFFLGVLPQLALWYCWL